MLKRPEEKADVKADVKADLKVRTTTAVVCMLAALVAIPYAQVRTAPRITPPNEQFGKNIGDDYFLVNWTQWVEYLRKMDRESDRMTVVEIGKTAEGRSQYTAIVTSAENHKRLAQFKEMNRRLALADGVTDDEARQLARDGKVVVWIDGGLHANEVLGAAQLIELTYRLNSATDAETMRILDDAIVLLTNVNPDGMELVSNWYMREPDERRRSIAGVPRLYQKYIGHDNNRDFYMMNQPESENANRVMYREWYPAIMYNHHQTGPAGAVLFAPPFRDPFNYHFDPLIPLGIDLVGAAIHTRLAVEGKPGAVMRSAASYSTWFNGGIRTTSHQPPGEPHRGLVGEASEHDVAHALELVTSGGVEGRVGVAVDGRPQTTCRPPARHGRRRARPGAGAPRRPMPPPAAGASRAWTHRGAETCARSSSSSSCAVMAGAPLVGGVGAGAGHHRHPQVARQAHVLGGRAPAVVR